MGENNFTKAENKGRRYCIEVFASDEAITDISFTEGTYDSADVDIYSADTYVIGEIKYRNGYAIKDGRMYGKKNKYGFDTAMLEAIKYNGLIKRANGKPIFYYMLFNNGIGYQWELTKMDLGNIYQRYTPATTVGDNNKYVLTDVYELPFKKGKMFTFNV